MAHIYVWTQPCSSPVKGFKRVLFFLRISCFVFIVLVNRRGSVLLLPAWKWKFCSAFCNLLKCLLRYRLCEILYVVFWTFSSIKKWWQYILKKAWSKLCLGERGRKGEYNYLLSCIQPSYFNFIHLLSSSQAWLLAITWSNLGSFLGSIFRSGFPSPSPYGWERVTFDWLLRLRQE